jgi:Malectin domain
LTFRSGAAGFYELCNEGGTGNIGGFRSGCTNNLVVAGGVLCAPDYTRTCTCSYQNQTSLALVPTPDAELWTFQGQAREVKGVIKRVGILLGAPGNRKADNGTLWLEHPPVGGPSPRLAIKVEPAGVEYFRRHSSQIELGAGSGQTWQGASGARNLRSLTVLLAGPTDKSRLYTVRLAFVEPDHLAVGLRVFDVALQGKTVCEGLDVSDEAGGPNRLLIKEFHHVKAGEALIVRLTPAEDAQVPVPVLCGVEVIQEGNP